MGVRVSRSGSGINRIRSYEQETKDLEAQLAGNKSGTKSSSSQQKGNGKR